MAKTALITGANRGIGLALAQVLHKAGWTVIGTARDLTKSQEMSDSTVHQLELDVSRPESIDAFAQKLDQHAKSIDLLINNAGLLIRDDLQTAKYDEILDQFKVNALGPIWVSKALLPLLRNSKNPRIVNITSRMGSIEDNTSGNYYGYRASKCALNMMTRSFSIDYPDVPVLLIHPGYIQTGMTSGKGDMKPEECAQKLKLIIDEFERPQDKSKYQSGQFVHRDGNILPW